MAVTNYYNSSVLTDLLFDNSGFLLCFGIVSRSLLLLISSAFLTAFCRDFVDVKGNIFAHIGKILKIIQIHTCIFADNMIY